MEAKEPVEEKIGTMVTTEQPAVAPPKEAKTPEHANLKRKFKAL